MILAVVIPFIYVVIAVFTARMIYQRTDWNDSNTDQENRVFSFGWGLLWPLSGMFIVAQAVMLAPGIREHRAAREEAARLHVMAKARELEKAEADLRAATDELKRIGIL